MTDEQRKRLTEYLGECWHILHRVHPSEYGILTCVKCGENMAHSNNRTFRTDADMMALYRAIYKKGKWKEFLNYTSQTTHYIPHAVWLFCLDSEDYESRCCLVAEWWVKK